MKNIFLLIQIISLALLLSACGEGGGGRTVVGGDNTIPITNCNVYSPLFDGDTVVKETDGTSVKIVDLGGVSREICVLTGAAHIVR